MIRGFVLYLKRSLTCGIAFNWGARYTSFKAGGPHVKKRKRSSKNCIVTEKSIMTVDYELEQQKSGERGIV